MERTAIAKGHIMTTDEYYLKLLKLISNNDMTREEKLEHVCSFADTYRKETCDTNH